MPPVFGTSEVLDDLESFYYYDDETNPHFVFNAIATNYFIQQMGEDKLKEWMKREDLSQEKLVDFLKNHCAVSDSKAFFLEQFKRYAEGTADLEYSKILN